MMESLVILFLAVYFTGPAGVEWREQRRARRRALADQPYGRVVYLPAAACRECVD